MEGFFALPLAVLLLILVPAGLLGLLGLVALVLRIVAVVQKAAEPRTQDQGHYGIDQGKDIGQPS